MRLMFSRLLLMLSLPTAPLAAQAPRTDLHGDPLPEGAIARLGTIRLRPGANPKCLDFSPDSKQLVCWAEGGNANALVFYDVATQKELQRIEALDSLVHAFVWLPDGRGLAVVQPARRADRYYLWEFTDPKSKLLHPGGQLEGNVGYQSPFLAISADGRWVASVKRDMPETERAIEVRPWTSGRMLEDLKPAQVWHLGRQKCHKLLFDHTSKVLLAFCTRDQAEHMDLLIIDLAKGEERRKFKLPLPFHLPLRKVALAPRQRLLAMGPEVKPCRILDLDSGRERKPLPFTVDKRHKEITPVSLSALTFSPDGRFLAFAGWQGWLRWWDVIQERLVWEVKDPDHQIGVLAVSPDGRKIVSGDWSYGVIRLWDAATGKDLAPQTGSPQSRVVRVVADGLTAICGGYYGRLQQWNLADGHLLREMSSEMRLVNLSVLPGSKDVLVVRENHFELWDLARNQLQPVSWLKGPTSQCQLSSDGKVLAIVRNDQVSICDWHQRKLRRTWSVADPKKPQEKVDTSAMVVSKDGSQVVLGLWRTLESDNDGRSWRLLGSSVELWDSGQGQRVRAFPQIKDRALDFMHSLTLTPEQDGVVLGSVTHGFRESETDNVPRWIDFSSGKVQRTFAVPANPHNARRRNVLDSAFSPDGRTLASAEMDHTIVLFEAATGLVRHVLTGHRNSVRRVAFTPDGRRLVSVSDDMTGLVWDLALASRAKGPAPAITLERAWGELTNVEDGIKVHQAMVTLAAAPADAVALIRSRLPPASVDPKRVAQLVAELDSTDFLVRSKAYAELDEMGETIFSLLRQHLKQSESLEVTRRLERLVDKHDLTTLKPPRLREIRALEILEHLATAEARRALAEMAKGAPSSRRTQDAAATLRRLQVRKTETAP